VEEVFRSVLGIRIFENIGTRDRVILTLSVYFWSLIPIIFSVIQRKEKIQAVLKMFLLTLIIVDVYFLLIERFFDGLSIMEVIGRCVLLPVAAWTISNKIMVSNQSLQNNKDSGQGHQK
jgi:hypothetical protein